jgi:hypothetical protein
MNRTSNVHNQNSSGHFSPKSPDCLPDGSGSHIRIEQKTCAVSELVTHYRMHTYRPGNLRDAQTHIRAVVQRNNSNKASDYVDCPSTKDCSDIHTCFVNIIPHIPLQEEIQVRDITREQGP